MTTSSDDASQIVDAILNRERPETDDDVYLGDLALHAAEFADDVNVVESIGANFPCVRRADGTIAPLGIGQSGETAARLYFWLFRHREAIGPPIISSPKEEILLVTPEAAQAYLRNGMVSFLTSRIQSLREHLEQRVERVQLTLPNYNFMRWLPPTVSTSGFAVRVSATPGLRVHVSPTFRRAWRFFASPTSPAFGLLPGGIYEFAVDGGAYPSLTPDIGVFDIPYATTTPSLAL